MTTSEIFCALMLRMHMVFTRPVPPTTTSKGA